MGGSDLSYSELGFLLKGDRKIHKENGGGQGSSLSSLKQSFDLVLFGLFSLFRHEQGEIPPELL